MKKLVLLALFLSTVSGAGLVNPGPSPSPIDNSLSGKQLRTKNAISSQATTAFLGLRNAMSQSWQMTWKNPLGLTPAQVFAGLGTDGCAAHMLFLGASQMLNGAAAGSWTLAEQCPVTCAQDGSATVVCPAPSPSPSASPSP